MTEKLKVQVEDAGPCRKKLRVFVQPDRIKDEIEEGFKNAGRYIKLPGFRPGHIPRKLLEQRYGDAIRREVKEHIIQETYREAIEEKKLAPLGTPEIDFEKINFSDQKPLEYEVAVDVRPTIDLKKYKGVEAKKEKLAVTTQEVDEQLTAFRRSRRRPIKDNEGKTQEEGFAVCEVEFFEDGKSVLKREGIRIAPVTPVVGADPEAFKKAFLGKKVGQSFELAIQYPEDFEVEAARGKKGKTKVSVTELYRFEEPTDEELLKGFDFPDMPTMRAETEKTILAHKEEMENRRLENAILDEIIKTHDFELPERIVKDQAESSIARFRSLREGAGIKGEELAKEIASKQKEIQEDAVRQGRGFFLIEAIGRKEKLFVTDEEMAAELQLIAARNQSPFQEVLSYYQQQNLLPMLRLELLERKVRSFLRENAKIT